MKKRLSAFLIAVALVMAMAVPASAAGFAASDDGGISPHYEPMPCCGAMGTWQTRWDEINWAGGRTNSCQFGYNCKDYTSIKYVGHRCANCGYIQDRRAIQSGYYCPTIGNYRYY